MGLIAIEHEGLALFIEQAAFAKEETLVFFHGVWRVTDQSKAWNLKGKARG